VRPILPDVLLSRRHAEVVRGPQGWFLRDLGSLNGTRLNGARVEGDESLRDGDRIGMSDWALVFHEASAPSDPAFAVAGARLRDVTELATRSDFEVGTLARQSRILGVLTNAAAAVVGASSADALLDTLLERLLEGRPRPAWPRRLFTGEPPSPSLAAARAVEGDPRWPSTPPSPSASSAPRGPSSPRAWRPRTAASGPSSVSPCGSAARLPLPRGRGLRGPRGPGRPLAVPGGAPASGDRRRQPGGQPPGEPPPAGGDRRQAAPGGRPAGRGPDPGEPAPEDTPAVPGWELAGSSRLCSAVGADYYDFGPTPDGLLLALGDVAGKGLAAALLMAALRASVRAVWGEGTRCPGS